MQFLHSLSHAPLSYVLLVHWLCLLLGSAVLMEMCFHSHCASGQQKKRLLISENFRLLYANTSSISAKLEAMAFLTQVYDFTISQK